VADQGLSSVTNLGATIFAAHFLDREGFGAFGLAWTIYLLALGVCRALTTEPLVSRYSLATPESLRLVGQAATGAAVAIGLIVSGLLITVATALTGPGRDGLTALAWVLPGLLLQDGLRYYFVTGGRPKYAAFNDATWLLALAGLLAVSVTRDHVTLTSIVLCFGIASGFAALIGCAQARILPKPTAAPAWLSQHRGLNVRYLAEYIMANGASQLVLVGLGTIAGLRVLGAIRGSYVFFGPMNVLLSTTVLTLTAEGARLRRDSLALRRMMTLATGALAILSIIWVIFGLTLPNSIGQGVFRDNWAPIRILLIPMGFAYIGAVLMAGAFAGLRALAAANQSLHARLLCLPLVIVAPMAGASFGARGFATGLAVSYFLGAAIWWRQFDRALASDHPTSLHQTERAQTEERLHAPV
jgi:hypothetical protein